MKRPSRWYDGRSRKNRLKILAARVAAIALGCLVGLAYRGLDNWPRHFADHEEMNCSRAGWGGDC